MPCSSCGKSRRGGPRSPMYAVGWLVYSPDGEVVAVLQSRAQAARDVRNGNRALPQESLASGLRWSYRAHRVPLDGSSPYEAALRTGTCVGCADGRTPPPESSESESD